MTVRMFQNKHYKYQVLVKKHMNPEPKPTQEVKRLQTQLAVMTDILKKKDEEIDFLRALADDKIGPVKIPNLSRVSESTKRGLQILASRFTETVRSKLAA